MQSQLLGLKSQMNPHFLFNSLNTLSSLINEDAEQAEDFLDHMSKVYRYLLRNNEEQLVSIDTELSFIQSYSYLLKSRYADALELTVNVSDRMRQEQIPPLTLQMIMENILNQNTISKDTPLKIEIISAGNHILVKNSRLSRLNTAEKLDEGLDNIANKFRLLCQQEIEIIETPSEREIRLPVIPKNEMMIA
jgi:LytS/YehU family sensor histidine kinase